MTDGHCFISYSTADAQDFATKLADELEGGYPHINAWFDKRDLRPGMEWDIQIDDGLKSCRLLLFVMTKDSTNEKSVCKQEWSRALSYKKLVIPILLHRDVNTPFRLGDRQRIDFTGNFEAGIAQLRRHIAWLDSPEGVLQSYKDRLSDAERDIQRASEGDKPRIKAEIEELKAQIKQQQEIVKNPKAAEEQTKKNIEAGLERERQPKKPVAAKTSTKFINPPPGIAPSYFQNRFIETKQIVDFLNNDAQRLMTIVGRAGVGKTAMICRLLKAIESGQLPDDLGEMKIDGIVYLSEAGSHRVNFANIFADLSKLLPDETAKKLEGIYKDAQKPTGDKMRALLDAFPQGHIALLLDNFENLIDPESLNLKDSELSDALNALLLSSQHAVNVVITTRIAPRDLALVEPGRQYILSLDDGLESPYAEDVLRELDANGNIGLKTAPDELLNQAREKTRGYPRALEALYAILSVDRFTTLEELLEIELPDEVVHKLVGEAFIRLDLTAQKVMQALAIYNRPVSSGAIDYLLQPYLPSIDSALVLNRLVNMHFARREAGKYYLHPADREYALSTIPDIHEETDFTQHDLTSRAADYFAQARKPRAEWRKLDDLSAQLAEFDLRCAAGDYDTAASVLSEFDYAYLLLWGHYRLMIEMNEKLKGKIKDVFLIGNSAGNLGSAYLSIGQTSKAINHYDQALESHRKIKNRRGESMWLGNLGIAYCNLGNISQAIKYYEQGLNIDSETGDRRSEAISLCNLGVAHSDLGNVHKSIEYHKQALDIAREIGDRYIEGAELDNVGLAYLVLQDYKNALQEFLDSIQIANEVSSPVMQLDARWGLAQAYLFQNDFVNARTTVEAALQYDVPANNHSASTLHGIIALRQGDEVAAREAFVRAIGQADEILSKTAEFYSALDAKGLSICGLLICDLRLKSGERSSDELIAEAVETFKKARKIAPHAGIVKATLRLFDELAKCDTEGILKDMRKAVEGV